MGNMGEAKIGILTRYARPPPFVLGLCALTQGVREVLYRRVDGSWLCSTLEGVSNYEIMLMMFQSDRW